MLPAILASTFLAGCSIFGSSDPVQVDPVAQDTAAAPADTQVAVQAPAPASSVLPVETETAVTPPPAPATPPTHEPAPETVRKEPAPVLTVRMPAGKEAELRVRVRNDIDKATSALSEVRRRELTTEQSDRVAMASRMVQDAEGALPNDPVRAGTLAEKARVLAEELKAQVVR